MKHIEKIVLIIASSVCTMSTAWAQIPVTDVAQNAQTLANQIANYAQYIEQVAQLKNQLTQMQQQYKSITGNRGMGSMFDDPQYRNYLPTDWQKVYDSVQQGGYGGLSGAGATAYSKNQIYDACASIAQDDSRTICEARAVQPSVNQGNATTAFAEAQARMNQIDQLMAEINQTQDLKAIAELQARIATEQAAIQNEETKLQLYKMVSDAQVQVEEQRQRESNVRDAARRGYVQPTPMQVTIGGAE